MITINTKAIKTSEDYHAALKEAEHYVNQVEYNGADDPDAWDNFEALHAIGDPEEPKPGETYGACAACRGSMNGTLTVEKDLSVRCDCCGHIAYE